MAEPITLEEVLSEMERIQRDGGDASTRSASITTERAQRHIGAFIRPGTAPPGLAGHGKARRGRVFAKD